LGDVSLSVSSDDLDGLDHEDWIRFYSREQGAFRELFDITRKTYSYYLGRSITEYDVVDKHLHLMGKSGDSVETSVAREIVDSEQYEETMKKSIERSYNEKYDGMARCSPSDVKDVWERIKRDANIGRADDRLRTLIAEHEESKELNDVTPIQSWIAREKKYKAGGSTGCPAYAREST
jgi:hypothetical protein